MKTRTATTFGVLATMLALTFAAPAAAAGPVDQAQLSHPDDGATLDASSPWQAQMFTVGRDGWLDDVSIYAAVIPDPAPGAEALRQSVSYNLEIMVNFEGLPGRPDLNPGATLAYGLLTAPATPGWIHFDLPGTFPHHTAIPVTAGQHLFILVSIERGWLLDWPGVCGSDAYPGGTALMIGPAQILTFAEWRAANPDGDPKVCQQDLAFQTFVSTTKPTPPATGTTSPARPSPSPTAPPLLFVAVALAAVFVTARRAADARTWKA
jgi:hypothetical protein